MRLCKGFEYLVKERENEREEEGVGGEGVDILIAGIEGQKDTRHFVTCIGEEL